MLFYLLSAFFQLQGVHGMSSYKEDFRFCADRRQTVEGHIRYETQRDAITISNGADGLNISAPFPSGPQQSWALPSLLGPYRFCVYWFQDDHLFNLTYGISHTYQLSNQANYSFSSLNVTCWGSKDGPDLLSNISYYVSNGPDNRSLSSMTGYKCFLGNERGTRKLEFHLAGTGVGQLTTANSPLPICNGQLATAGLPWPACHGIRCHGTKLT